ncbi:MAG: ATP-binding protein [Synechococcales cyanobacterium RM1_1_8]|nr:ATP-binding protein [Synechococcales cyanobacterium RM1_1_8]
MIAISQSSDLATINAAIARHNPFSQPPFVNANNVWGKGFPDLESLNAHASDAVFEAIRQIREGQYPTVSILITAQNGTGKTHIIGRIRHRLQEQGGALFVFVNKLNDINDSNGSFQQALSRSLSNIGSEGVKQWQELAASIANFTLQSRNKISQGVAAKQLVEKFGNSSEERLQKWVKELSKQFCKQRSVNDPDLVKAILWTLSDEQEPYASNWLAGKELAQYKANELLLPTQKKSFDAVVEILDLIGDYKEVVICFDELDVLDINDAGLHKSLVVANLTKDLLQNLKRGIILSVMMPGTWNERIKQLLPGGVSSKMTTYGQPLDLKYMDGDSIIELVTHSVAEYFRINELIPPNPLYPFDEADLRVLGKEKLTIREVLQWCKDNCVPKEQVNVSKSANPVEEAFASELEEAVQADLDDNHLLGNALYFSFKGLQGKTLEGVKIKEVTNLVKKGKRRDPYLNFKIIGEENGRVCIGVAVLQQDGGNGLAAGFKRLLDHKDEFKLTRGSLVRSKRKSISSHLRKNYLKPFINQNGGEFVELKPDEIRPLLAIRSVFLKRESEYGLTEAQISEFIAQQGEARLLGIHNPLLREILSDPSHQVPDLAEEPEAEAIALEEIETDSEDESTDATLAELITVDE